MVEIFLSYLGFKKKILQIKHYFASRGSLNEKRTRKLVISFLRLGLQKSREIIAELLKALKAVKSKKAGVITAGSASFAVSFQGNIF